MTDHTTNENSAARLPLLQALEGRRSIRRYLPDPVPDDHLREIVRLATLAPSASNKQMWRFVAVRDRNLLNQMAAVIEEKIEEMAAWPESKGRERQILASKSWNLFFTGAPVTFVVLVSPYASSTEAVLQARGLSPAEIDALRQRPDLQSIGAAVENLLLAAYAYGYGTVWMTGPLVAARELEKLLGIEPPWRIACLVPMGRPAEHPEPHPRKPLAEVLEIR
ncbi:MAG: nitroreductase family protein [Firmicutes bacterium]|nr:nitroreductase family protein [Bacillota bacterium]